MWLQGDLNLQAKLLILLRWIPTPKQNPSNHLMIAGVFHRLGCGDAQQAPS
jgi:hypothetical protein